MVIAIERNHWPLEWRYLIRLEQLGKPPKPHTAILDRGLLNTSDDLHYIRPEAANFRDNDVAFFFNAFEQVLHVTIIQKVEPSSHETVRMTQPSSRNRSPSMTIQTIESHRLFTQEMLAHYEETVREELVLVMSPQQATPHRLKDEMESIPLLDYKNPTTLGQRGPLWQGFMHTISAFWYLFHYRKWLFFRYKRTAPIIFAPIFFFQSAVLSSWPSSWSLPILIFPVETRLTTSRIVLQHCSTK